MEITYMQFEIQAMNGDRLYKHSDGNATKTWRIRRFGEPPRANWNRYHSKVSAKNAINDMVVRQSLDRL